MRNPRTLLAVALLALAAIAIPGIAAADLVCPFNDVTPVTALGAGEVVEVVVSTLIRKGIAVLLAGATAVVSLPWLVAGGAAAALSVAQGQTVTRSSVS